MKSLAVKPKLAPGPSGVDGSTRLIEITSLVADPQKESVAANDELAVGPYYDGESGLIYNWNNYFDPKTGRWLTPDRVSVARHVMLWKAGLGKPNQMPLEINPYLYVNANPLRWTDPEGLMGNMPGHGTYRPGHGPVSFIEAISPGPFGPVCGSGPGATWIPDGPWRDACQKHDECYSKCGAKRLTCDLDLFFDTYNLPYFIAVLRLGDKPFQDAQKNCSCSQE